MNYSGGVRFNIFHSVLTLRAPLGCFQPQHYCGMSQTLVRCYEIGFLSAVESYFLCLVQEVSIKHVLDLSFNCNCKPCGTVGLK